MCLTFKYLHIFYLVAIIEHFYMLFSAFVLNSIQSLVTQYHFFHCNVVILKGIYYYYNAVTDKASWDFPSVDVIEGGAIGQGREASEEQTPIKIKARRMYTPPTQERPHLHQV